MSGGALRLLFSASLENAVNKRKYFISYLAIFYFGEFFWVFWFDASRET